MLGGGPLLVRETAAHQVKGEYGLLRGLLLRYRQASLVLSLVLILVAGFFAFLFYRQSPGFLPFLIALALVPLLSNIQLQSSALRGLRRIILGQAARTLRPLLLIIQLGILYWYIGPDLSPEAALVAQVVGCSFLVLLTWFLLGRALPFPARHAEPEFDYSGWLRSALPFLFVGGMQILTDQTSAVILGAMQGAEEVGLFRVAQRGALLIAFGLQAVNMAIAPNVSALFARGEKVRLQRMIRKSVLAVLAYALPLGLGLIIFGPWLIPWVFGAEFGPAYMVMVILCIGQLVNVMMGSVGLILSMIGLERYTARGVGIAAGLNVMFNFALIPVFGTIGAAIATSISLITWNVLLAFWLYRETGIVSAFYFKKKSEL